MFSFTVYGFFEDGTNQQTTWQGECSPGEDLRGRGYPDWLPENTTTLAPPSPTSRFVDGAWVK
jgi:hypothetical protein